LEDLEEQTQCLGPTPFGNCGDSLQESVPVLAGIYLFMTNIVLINLLIAMMAKTFADDIENSLKLYNVQKYDLLIEYGADKSRFPNPLSALKPVYETFRWARDTLRGCTVDEDEEDEDETNPHARQMREKKDRYRQLESFQEKNTERYADFRERQMKETDSSRIAAVQIGHERVRRYMEELHTQTQRLDLCVIRTFEKVAGLTDYTVYHMNEMLRRMRELQMSSGGFDGPIQQSMSDNMTWSEEDEDYLVLPGFESRYDDEIGTGRYSVASTNYVTYMESEEASKIAYAQSPDRSWGHWKGTKFNARTDLKYFKHPQHGTVYFRDDNPPATGDARPPPPQDALLLVCYEAELKYFCDEHHTASAEGLKEAIKPHDVNGKVVHRAQIPLECMSWDVEWNEYDPPYYVSPYVLYFSKDCTANPHFKWADAENIPPDAEITHVNYGKEQQTAYEGGLPRNPFGRTGLRGRGLLGKWGPNPAQDQIVTRWKRNANNMQTERNGKPMLEVLLCKRKMGGEWALPGCFKLPSDGVNPVLRKVFGLDEESLSQNEDLQTIQRILKMSKVFYHGQTCDPRDTDNAWVESRVTHVHDTTGMLKDHAMTDPKDPAIEAVTWAVVHKNMKLFANHAKIIENLALKLDAYWEE